MIRSKVVVTEEIYDPALATKELLEQLSGFFPLSQNSCAVLFAEPDYDMDELLQELSRELSGGAIIGCTAMAQLSVAGYHRLAASLLLMTSDDCFFSAAAVSHSGSEGLAELPGVYARAKHGLNGLEPECAFVFSHFTEERFEQQKIDLLNDLLDGKPIFGGVAADYFDFSTTRVFLNDKVYEQGLVLLLLAGNVRPKFVVRNLPKSSLARHRVTKAQGLFVETIDNTPALDFLLNNDIDIDYPLGFFYTPFNIDLDNEEDYDGQPICRPLLSVDKETGIAKCVADIPQGANVSLQRISGEDILETTREAFAAMAECLTREEEDGYRYSTILVATCAGRHIVLGLEHAREAALAQELFPPHLMYLGYYSYGEFCPTSVRNGKARNRVHHLSVALCAL